MDPHLPVAMRGGEKKVLGAPSRPPKGGSTPGAGHSMNHSRIPLKP
jgi:hypothetical protein